MPDRNIKLVQESNVTSTRAPLPLPCMPEYGDVPDATDTITTTEAVGQGGKGSSSKANDDNHNLHVVYDSEKDVAPYPDGEYIRTPSPEHTGIPVSRVRPAVLPSEGSPSPYCYTSDEGDAESKQTGRRRERSQQEWRKIK